MVNLVLFLGYLDINNIFIVLPAILILYKKLVGEINLPTSFWDLIILRGAYLVYTTNIYYI